MADIFAYDQKSLFYILLLHSQHSREYVHWILSCLIYQQEKCRQVSGPGTMLFLGCTCKIQDETDELHRCYGRQNLWARKIHSLISDCLGLKGCQFKPKQNKQKHASHSMKQCGTLLSCLYMIQISGRNSAFASAVASSSRSSCFFFSCITLLVPPGHFKWLSTSALQALLLPYTVVTPEPASLKLI